MSEVAPAGYKQTEVGVIPQDWEAVSLGSIASFRTGPFGSALHKSDYVPGGVPVINPMHIVSGRLQPTFGMSITAEAQRRLSDYAMRTDDIVIGRRGDMGRCAVVEEPQAGWICGTGSMLVRTRDANPAFLQRILSDARAKRAIEDASVGSTMINLNQGTLAALKVPFPPVAEQRAIAEALGDMDALLDALARLIAKKRDLKQATMQQLLTARTRLPGFTGEWKSTRIGDLVTIDPENLPATTDPHFAFDYISLECVNNGRLRQAIPTMFCTAPSRARRVLRHGDVLMATVRPNLKAHLLFRGGLLNPVCSTGFAVLRPNSDVCDPAYLFAHLFADPINVQINALLAGSNYPAINSRDVTALTVPCPPTVEEQTAIATVLSDMDAEIAALEARRAKTGELKQAMMQELLTGRTRLV